MSKDNKIDTLIEHLDLDDILLLAEILDVDVSPPPLDDMWPDWINELSTEVGEELGKLVEHENAI